MSGPSPEVCRWLVSTEGRSRVTEAAAELERSDALAVGTELRRRGVPPDRAAAVTSVAAARLRARERYDDADGLLFTTTLLEQASHPVVSRWRAARFAERGTVVDLCCGAGSDALALSEVSPVLAIDRSPSACILARHNLTTTGRDASVAVGDATAAPIRAAHPIHIDPARRDGSRRAHRLAGYHPPVPSVLPMLRDAPGGGLVVSPAVDLDDPDLPGDGELEFVQLGDDLLEAIVWFGELRGPDTASSATILGPDGTLRSSLRRIGPPVDLPIAGFGRWLVEAAPAVVRARLHHEVGADLEAWRIAERRALLSTDRRPAPSPLYRIWEVEAVLPVRPRDIRRWLHDAEDLPLEIATHGIDLAPDAMWSQLGSPERGPGGRRLHLVRLDEGAAAVATCAG